ncbi:MAG: hypothetical protein US49_C0006G0071 [candidate division TM6 bacterium GW2011_GWF2_37_49]|nr:MAG: hypothetical protein US49_C0006G0071 [candidate division TM6 bacterium GW2011_GWF2_37_49]
MLFEITFIEVLFKLTIFSLLLIKILQLFKSYGVPYLFDEIKREKAVRTELIEKENLVKSTQNKIENQIRNQNKLFLDLEKNVQKWHAYLRQEEDVITKKLADAKIKIERKRNIQRNNYVITTIYSVAMPKAIKLAQKELESNYLNQDGILAFNKLIENISNG